MDPLAATGTVTSVIQLAARVLSYSQEYYVAVKDAKLDIQRLQKNVESIKNILESVLQLLQGPDGARLQTSQNLQAAVASGSAELEHIADALGKKLNSRRRAMIRFKLMALKWPLEKREVNDAIARLKRDQQAISFALTIDSTKNILAINSKLDLSRIPAAKGAVFDSQANEHEPECLPGTRMEVLANIDNWAKDLQGHCIYWLCGLAGTGKSTISRTVTRNFIKNGVPTASFFFKKGEGDRGKASFLFTTIAAQLMRLPEVTSHIREAVDADPDISDKNLSRQFEELILNPLTKAKDSFSSPIVVVLDALDECDNHDDVATVIRLLQTAKSPTAGRLKFFVTSRPDLPMRISFQRIRGDYEDIALHEVPASDIRRDISTYMKFQLGRIRDDFNSTIISSSQLPDDWPSATTVDALVDLSVPLFIFASTVCRFVSDPAFGDPEELAARFIRYNGNGKLNQLSMTYLPVLNQMLSKTVGARSVDRTEVEKQEIVAKFRDIVGTIVLLAETLSTESLSKLISFSQRAIDAQLNMLHSVLAIPKDSNTPIKLFHLSFRDFLIDPKSQVENPFYVDERSTHAKIASYCLDLLSTGNNLKEDICGLKNPGAQRSNIHQDIINKFLPPHVRYACLYWVFHLKQGNARIRDDDSTHNFIRVHFLHWLEALSLLGRITESLYMLDNLLGLVDITDGSCLLALLRDAKTITRSNRRIIDLAPLQLYSSILLFSPQNSLIRRQFDNVIPRWIKLRPAVRADWDPCLQTLEGHPGEMRSAVFSPDSSFIAASQSRQILVWRTETGECIKSLQVHESFHRTMIFSPDSSQLVTLGEHCDLHFWNTATWECNIKSHINLDLDEWPRYGVRFSHDLQYLLVGQKNTVCKFKIDTGEIVKTQDVNARYYAFSPDLRLMMLDDENGVHLWDVSQGYKLRSFVGGGWKQRTFSPNSQCLALRQRAGFQVYRVGASECALEVKLQDLEVVEFSHDSSLIAGGFFDGTIKVWRVDTSVCLQTLEGHTSRIFLITFSHDSTMVLSSSRDGMLRVWSLNLENTGPDRRLDKRNLISHVEHSADLKLILSRGYNYTQVWNAENGNLLKEFYNASFLRDSTVVGFGKGISRQAWCFDGTDLVGRKLAPTQVISGWPKRFLSTEGRLVASFEVGHTLLITRYDTGELVREVKPIPECVDKGVFSPDSSLLVLCMSWSKIQSESDQDTIWILRIETQEPLQKLEGVPSDFPNGTISHDSKLIAYVGKKAVHIRNIESGSIMHKIDVQVVCFAVFSHDSLLLALSDSDYIRIWALDKGTWVCEIDFSWEKNLYDERMSFTPDDQNINTKYGVYRLPKLKALLANTFVDQQIRAYCIGLGIGNERQWLTWNEKFLLWIPAEYRRKEGIVAGSTAVLVNTKNELSFIGFLSEELPETFGMSTVEGKK